MKILIENDVLDIVFRLKQIDDSYFVIFNTGKKKFELHSKEQNNSYCLTFPFNQLDERAVDMTYQTQREKIKEILANMEKENQKLIKNNY